MTCLDAFCIAYLGAARNSFDIVQAEKFYLLYVDIRRSFSGNLGLNFRRLRFR